MTADFLVLDVKKNHLGKITKGKKGNIFTYQSLFLAFKTLI
jgi:hypothetical protein